MQRDKKDVGEGSWREIKKGLNLKLFELFLVELSATSQREC